MRFKPIILIVVLLAVIIMANVTIAAIDDRQIVITNIATSANTDPVHPGGFLADDNPDTYWAVISNSGPGWAEISLNKESLIYGLQVSGNLASNSRLTVESWQNGYWLPFCGGSLKLIPEQGIIDLSYDRAVTTKIRLRLDGSRVGTSKIAEIKVLGCPVGSVFQLIQPLEIKYSKDIHPTTPARFLNDRNLRTAWRINDDNEDDCADIRNNRLFKHDAFWDRKIRQTQTDSGRQVEMELGSTYRVNNINLYITNDATGSVLIKIVDGRHWREVGRLDLDDNSGWQRIDLSSQPVETDRILIELEEDHNSYSRQSGRNRHSGKPERSGGIGEVQLWGYGLYKGSQRQWLQAAPQVVTQTLNYRFNLGDDNEDFQGNRLELAVAGTYNHPVKIELNGLPVELQPTLKVNGNTVYQYIIPEDTLWDGDNFVRILPGDPVFTVLQLQITENYNYGEIPITAVQAGSLNDNLLLTPIIETGSDFNLNRESFIEAVEIYAPGNLAATVSAKTGNGLVPLNQVQTGSGYLRFQGGINANGLNVINHTGLPFAEIRVLGSPGPNTTPEIKIIWPRPANRPGEELPDCDANDREYLLGRVDNPEAKVTANGKLTYQSGNYFWIRLRDLELDYGEINIITVKATDPAGQASVKQLEFFWGDSPSYHLDQKDIIYYTDKLSFTISGRVGSKQYEVFINGKPVTIDRNRRFSATVSLVEGFNLIPITFNYNYRGKEMHYTIHRRVIRESSGPILTINSPLSGTVTNSNSVVVSGTVGGNDPYVKINRTRVTVTNGYFTSNPITLMEGTNTIKVEATDSYGRKTSREIMVVKDSKLPVISNLSPVNGFLSGTAEVTVSGKVTDAGQVYVYVNEKLAVYQNGSFNITLTLPDGENQIPVKVVDQAGNMATVTMKIKVDTQPPLEFTPSADSSGWTNNNKPTIAFATTDGFSGIDHYEITVGDGAFIKPVASPYKFTTPISDGEQIVRVKAVDKAGNYIIGEVKVYIDTTPPAIPDKFEAIPGINRMIIKWQEVDLSGETVGYRIRRTPAFSNGSYKDLYRPTEKEDLNQFIDREVTPGTSYTYTIQAIDHVGNISAETKAIEVKAGDVIESVNPEGGTVKFDNAELIFSQNSLSTPGQVVIKEAANLPDNNYASKVSPGYSFSLLNDQGQEIQAEFSEPVNLKISYADMDLPSGYTLSDLGVYWYNKIGGYWEKLDYAIFNLKEETISVNLKHFSEYQVMASNYISPSLDSYYDMGVSPFKAYFQNNLETVSPSCGNLTISATDLKLPGRNGYGLIIRRIYDSITAQQEKMIAANSKEYQTIPIDTFGYGWALNIPWIEQTDKGKFIHLPEGQTIKIELDYKGIFEYNTGIHFVMQGTAALTMNDGSKYEFDGSGKATRFIDPSGQSVIKYEYNNRELSKITYLADEQAGIALYTVNFNYQNAGSKRVIASITVGDRTISYKYNTAGVLTEAEDPLNRKTFYAYESHIFKEGNNYDDNDDIFAYSVDLLNEITYPTGEKSSYSYEFRDRYHRETIRSYYFFGLAKKTYRVKYEGTRVLISKHVLAGKETVYTYQMNAETGSFDDNDFVPAYIYMISSQVTEGDRTQYYTFNQIVNNRLASVSSENISEYEGSLAVECITGINGREVDKTTFKYYVPIRAITSEKHYRGGDNKYEITSKYDKWGNLTYRLDGSHNLEETWTYHKHDRIKNLVETVTQKNYNPVNRTYSTLTTTYDYDDNLGKPLKITVNDGSRDKITNLKYDSKGNLQNKIEEFNDNLKIEYCFDTTYQVYPVKQIVYGLRDADGKTTDDNGNPKIIETEAEYDPVTGLRRWEKDARGYITSYEYDKLNRVTKVVLPDDDNICTNNPCREYKFYDDPDDPKFNTCDFYNEKRQLTNFKFDGLGRLTDIIKDTSENDKPHTIYHYDSLGRIDTVTDPMGNITSYDYDGLNRVIKVEFPMSNNPAVITAAGKLIVTLEYNDVDNSVTIIEYQGSETGAEIGRTVEKSDWANRLVSATQSCLYEGTAIQYYNWQFNYDSIGNKLQQIDPLLSQTDQTFDAFGHLIEGKLPTALLVKNDDANPEGTRPTLNFEYDQAGNRTAEIDAKGNRVEYDYDQLGRVIKITTNSTNYLNNQTITSEIKNYYDAGGNKIKVIDAKGNSWDYTYSARGWLLAEKDPLGNVTRYHYDVLGNKTSVTDPRNKTGYKIVAGKVVLDDAADNHTYTTWYIYDDLNRLRRTVLPDATPPGVSNLNNGNYDNPFTEITYDMNGNKLSERDPNCVLTEYTYTPRNQVERVKVNGKVKAQYTYDAKGNLIKTESVAKDEGNLSFVTENKYDSLGRLRKISRPLTEEEYEYDAVGNRTGIKDGKDNPTYYRYNSLGWLISIQDPLNNLTRFHYDLNGNQVKIIAANDRLDNRMITSGYYDELNRVYKTVDTLGKEIVISYDLNGNRDQMIDRRGSTWRYQYENNNLLKRLDVKNGENSYFVEYTYDAAGNRTQVEDNSNTNNYSYNELAQLTQVERNFDGKKYTTGYQYDKSRLTGIKYPEATKWLQYQYDTENRITEVTGFTAPQGITYDADGALREITLTNGITTGYDYDNNRRLNNLQVSSNIMQLSYIYDKNNNITQLTDNGKVKTYEYDKNNQLTKSVINGKFMEEKPTPGSYGLKIGDYLGASWMDFTPTLNAMVGLDYNSSSIGIDFGYNQPGVKKIQLIPDNTHQTHRIDERTLDLYTSGDNLTYTIISRDGWEFVKDNKGIITITLKDKLATRYLKIHVKFDERNKGFVASNRVTFLNDLAKMLRVYQEATSRTEDYQYDAAGNRRLQRVTLIQTTEINSQYYPNSDRLKTDGKYQYFYDDAGNMTSKERVNLAEGEPAEKWQYEYDLLNRLIAVRKNGTIIAEYGYDPEGLRVIKKAKGVTTHYIFEGTEPIFEKRISDVRVRSYIYAFGKHLARVDGVIGDAGAKKFFYHTDQVGSVRAVTNDTGQVVWKSDYLAFGTQFGKDKLDPTFEEDEFAFTGKGFDGDTGLYYYNARWYDSETGRFMSEDPVRDPNNPNLYSMGRNNPLRFTDPTGCISQEDAMSEHARNSSSSPSYDWSGNYSYSGGPSNKGSSPKIEPGSFKRTNEEGRPVWDMGYYVDGVFVPNQNNGSMSFFIEYWINTFKDQAKKLGISARFTEGFVCGALDDICTFAMMYSKTNLLNPINVFNLIVGSYNFAKSGLNLIGAINKSDKTEITEFLNSIKQSLGDEFVKPFTDVFNDLKNGISADNAFEFGRSAYKSVMTILIVAAAGKAAIKGGTALAKAFNKGEQAAASFVFDLQYFASEGRLTAKQATDLAGYLGFKKTNFVVKGQPVFTNGKIFITPDVDSHIGGIWKAAKTVENLASKGTRMGTFDALLNKIGD